MAKKMRLPPLFKHKNPPQRQPLSSLSSSTRHSWVPCREHPKTLSFRAADTHQDHSGDEAEELESVIREVKIRSSDQRLFFSPEKTNSILKKTTTDHKLIMSTQPENNAPITITMESLDPYTDFRTSMEEMVEAHELIRRWDLLEELLGCYLMLNEKRNHCHIIRAFADLVLKKSHIVNLTSSNSSICCSPPSDLVSDSFVTSFSSPLHLSSSSTTAETSCSSSFAPAEAAAHDRGRRGDDYSNIVDNVTHS